MALCHVWARGRAEAKFSANGRRRDGATRLGNDQCAMWLLWARPRAEHCMSEDGLLVLNCAVVRDFSQYTLSVHYH